MENTNMGVFTRLRNRWGEYTVVAPSGLLYSITLYARGDYWARALFGNGDYFATGLPTLASADAKIRENYQALERSGRCDPDWWNLWCDDPARAEQHRLDRTNGI